MWSVTFAQLDGRMCAVVRDRSCEAAFRLEQVKLTVHTASPSLGVAVRNTGPSKESVRLLRATLYFRPDIST